MCFLKINTFSKYNACILKYIVQGTQEGIEILVGQAVFKLWFKTVYFNILNAIFWVPWTIYFKMHACW